MSNVPVKKALYNDADMLEIFGFSKRKMRTFRTHGAIQFCNTRPIYYTAKMVEDFIKTIDSNPDIISLSYYKGREKK
jgi:hypothetical protein